MTTEKTLQLPLGLVNGIMGYLSTRPYSDVYQLIQAIQAQANEQLKAEPENPAQ